MTLTRSYIQYNYIKFQVFNTFLNLFLKQWWGMTSVAIGVNYDNRNFSCLQCSPIYNMVANLKN